MRLRVEGFDDHRFEDLLEFFVKTKSGALGQGGGRGRIIEVDDLHELASYLMLQEFDADRAFGNAAITSSEGGSVTFVHKLKFTFKQGEQRDYLDLSVHTGAVAGEGQVTCGPTLVASAESDDLAAEQIKQATFIGRRMPERLSAAGVKLAQQPAITELMAMCREKYDDDLAERVASLGIERSAVLDLLEHPMAKILREVQRERSAAKEAQREQAARREAEAQRAEMARQVGARAVAAGIIIFQRWLREEELAADEQDAGMEEEEEPVPPPPMPPTAVRFGAGIGQSWRPRGAASAAAAAAERSRCAFMQAKTLIVKRRLPPGSRMQRARASRSELGFG